MSEHELCLRKLNLKLRKVSKYLKNMGFSDQFTVFKAENVTSVSGSVAGLLCDSGLCSLLLTTSGRSLNVCP